MSLELKSQINKAEQEKDIKTLEEIQENAEVGFEGEIAGLAKAAIDRLRGKVEDAEKTPDHIVEKLGEDKLEEVTAEVDKEIENLQEKTEGEIEGVVGNIENGIDRQKIYAEIQIMSQKFLRGDWGDFVTKKLDPLTDESIELLLKKVKGFDNRGFYFNINSEAEGLQTKIGNEKWKQFESIKKGLSFDLKAGDKFKFIENRLNELDNMGRLHGISARQLNELLKQVMRGEKTLKDLQNAEFTLDKSKTPITLEKMGSEILFDLLELSGNGNMERIKRITYSFNLTNELAEALSKIENGIYVNPNGGVDAGVTGGETGTAIIKKANEIMGLTAKKKKDLGSSWTDLNNPPTAWDKNARVGDKIRP